MKEIISRPIGLDIISDQIDNIADNPLLYRQLGVPSFIVQLDKGEGRSTIIKYAVERFKGAKFLNFDSGRKDFLEITFDGSYTQYETMMHLIENSKDYSNHFERVLSMDITKIASHSQERHYIDLINSAPYFCQYGCMFFWLPFNAKTNELELANKLKNAVGNNNLLHIIPESYTNESITQISESMLSNLGIDSVNASKLSGHIGSVCTSVKDASTASGIIYRQFCFGNDISEINTDDVKKYIIN